MSMKDSMNIMWPSELDGYYTKRNHMIEIIYHARKTKSDYIAMIVKSEGVRRDEIIITLTSNHKELLNEVLNHYNDRMIDDMRGRVQIVAAGYFSKSISLECMEAILKDNPLTANIR